MTTRAHQTFRRYSAVALCALAGLILSACGGGEVGPGHSRLDSTIPFSERPSSGAQSGDQGSNEQEPQESGQASSSGADTNPDKPEQTASGDGKDDSNSTADGSAGGDSDPVADSGSTSNEETDTGSTNGDSVDSDNDQVADAGSNDGASSSSASSSDLTSDDDSPRDENSLADSDEPVKVDDGSVTLEWYRPQYRENGDLIRDGEIGGYEVRYRQVGAQEPQSIVIDGEWAVEYELDGLEKGEYEFSIAAYDINGLYSEFVRISPLQ